MVVDVVLVDAEPDLRSREVEIQTRVVVRFEDETAGRQNFGLLQIEVLDAGDEPPDDLAI